MSLILGSNVISGTATNTKSNAHSLLDFKWSDHILNEMCWLRGDTFSWQSGDVYVAAYEHLTSDYSNGTSKSETIGSYTINYVEAPDGHKITTDETNAINIYNTIGVAWYYILDTTNHRFKLPHSSKYHGEMIKSYSNGTNWYRIYEDGWCEQGGQTPKTTDAVISVSFLLSFTTDNPNVQFTRRFYYDNDGTYSQNRTTGISSVSSSGFKCYDNAWAQNGGSVGVWKASGYIINSTNSLSQQYRYLYFYVGEFDQSATEQTAGITATQLNAKLDLDLGNATNSSKEAIVGFNVPNYAGVTEYTENTTFHADKDYYVLCYVINGNYYGNIYADATLQTNIYGWQFYIQASANSCKIPVCVLPKGTYYTSNAHCFLYPFKGES